jgi:hypothetical protein
MMRSMRKFGAFVVAIFALSVIGVTNASAAQFTFSETGELAGEALEPPKFGFNGGTVECSTVDTSGNIESKDFSELELTAHYSGCKAFGIANVDISPATYLFTANGEVHIKEAVTITVTKTVLSGECAITLPAQTVGTVDFATSGNNLKMTPTFTGIKYTSSGAPCGTSGENGTYTGPSEIHRVGGGTVSFDP